MKINFNPTISNQKVTIKSKFKRFLTDGRIRLKTLVKDVFEKKNEKKVLVARKDPNWCQTEEDMPNNAVIKMPITFEEFAKDCEELGLNPNDFIIKH